MLQRLSLPALLLAVWLLALLWRLLSLDQATVGSDSLGQFLTAYALSPGHLPMPPNPEAATMPPSGRNAAA